jgi:hypothetical protein
VGGGKIGFVWNRCPNFAAVRLTFRHHFSAFESVAIREIRAKKFSRGSGGSQLK